MSDKAELKSKVIKGSLWSLMENFSLQIVQFIVSVVLARILEPKDYGLIAITGIFTSISAAITDGGFEKTVIQKKDPSQIQISTIFYMNIFLGALMTLLLIISSPVIAVFFKEPALTPILEVIAFSIFLNSLGQMQQTLLMKELQFRKISYARIVGSWVSGISGVLMALNGFGVWSLVCSSLLYQITMLLFFWIKSPWYPQFKFSFNSVKSIVPYGLNILASSIFYFMIQQFNNFIVGKSYSKTDLGLFNRGNKFPDLITGVIQSVVLNMSLPLFSKLQDDPEGLSSTVQKTNKIIAFISFPLLFLLLIKADDITIFLFTEKWRGSIIFLQLFCVIKIFEPFISIQRELILAQGKSKLLLKIFTFTSLIEIVLTLCLIRFGILYIVLSTFISRIIQIITYTIVSSYRLQKRWINEFNWSKPYLLVTLLMSITVIASEVLLRYIATPIPLLLKLTIQFLVGLIAYIFFAYRFKLDEIALIYQVKKILLHKK
jgi:teichuronic acid exporter